MRLEHRLLLFGVALPIFLMVGSGVIVGRLLDRALREGVDRTLAAQAASERASLFDGPGGHPHLHAREGSTRPFVGDQQAAAAIYDARGVRVVEDGAVDRIPETMPPPSGSRAVLRTRAGFRTLALRVEEPGGDAYTLLLARNLAPIGDAMTTFWRIGGVALLLASLLLLVAQRRHVRWLTLRLEALAGHVSALGAGDLGEDPPPDTIPDVVGELRDATAMATDQMRRTRGARERMMAGAAHELRTPLATLRATVDVTLRRERNNAELRTALIDVGAEVERLEGLARDLLELGALRAEGPRRERIQTSTIARRSIARFEDTATLAEVTLTLRIVEDAAVSADPTAVGRALDNLLRNALAHAPRASVVEVALDVDDELARIRVQDEGEGVPDGDEDAVFTPFHRSRRDTEGVGLGLTLVREIAEQHSGHARVVRGEGRGACFEITLPRARAPR